MYTVCLPLSTNSHICNTKVLHTAPCPSKPDTNMKNKTEIVTCRFLPQEKTRLLNVCEHTELSVSSITRIAVNEYLDMHGVADEAQNKADFVESIRAEYKEYKIREWSPEPEDLQDYRQENINKLIRMRANCNRQIDRLQKEKNEEDDILLRNLEEDRDQDIF